MEGGAIFSLKVSTTVDNCYFFKCTARNGGAIFGKDDVNIYRSTFSNTAALNAGAVQCKDAHFFRVEATLFSHTSAITNGAIDRAGGHHSPISFTNFSSLCATENHGIGGCFVARLSLSKCFAKDVIAYIDNGGFSTEISTTVNIDQCAFVNVSCRNIEKTGHVLFTSGDCSFGTLSNSFFLTMLPQNSAPLIFVVWARWFKIIHCSFSCEKKQAICTYDKIQEYDNTFGNCPIPTLLHDVQIGYSMTNSTFKPSKFSISVYVNCIFVCAFIILIWPLTQYLFKYS